MAEQPGNQTPNPASGAEVRDRPVEKQQPDPGTAGGPGIADVATDPVREVITVPDDAGENGAVGEADGPGADAADSDAGSVPAGENGSVHTAETASAGVADTGSIAAADTDSVEVRDDHSVGAADSETVGTADASASRSAADEDGGAAPAGGDTDVADSSDTDDVGAGPDDGHVRIGEETSSSIKYSQEITSPEDEPEREGRSLATTHHEVIKQWAEERGGTPATVDGTEHGDHLGVLRLDFGGNNQNLRHVSWDEWFHTFDARRLNFIYQEQRRDGHQSNFFRLESPDREDA